MIPQFSYFTSTKLVLDLISRFLGLLVLKIFQCYQLIAISWKLLVWVQFKAKFLKFWPFLAKLAFLKPKKVGNTELFVLPTFFAHEKFNSFRFIYCFCSIWCCNKIAKSSTIFQCYQLFDTQCENFRIFLSLRFYVKSKLANLASKNLLF